MSTHIAAKKGEIASTVLISGDPIRAENFSKKYLTNYKMVSSVRLEYVFTGFLKGTKKRITVMSSGMGMGSFAIYANELYNFYGVDRIIRFGTCGAYDSSYEIGDLIVPVGAYTESNIIKIYNLRKNKIIKSNIILLEKIIREIKSQKNEFANIHYPIIHSTDNFYNDLKEKDFEKFVKKNIKVVDMETAILYAIANFKNKKAFSLLQVSDNLITKKQMTPEERSNDSRMFKLLFNLSVNFLA